jgi:hypothetical protein
MWAAVNLLLEVQPESSGAHIIQLMDRHMPATRVVRAGKAGLFLLALGVASAQIYPPGGYPPGGGYPGGGYPPGGYPGGGYPGGYPGSGGGIPIPGRSKKQPDTSTKGMPMPNFRGKLKKMDSKTITLALDDDRMLDFRRNDKTKFYKNGDEIKDPKFTVGDQLSIEGPEDNTGAMIAVNVYWEKGVKADATDTAAKTDGAKKDDKVPDTWADAPNQQHTPDATPKPSSSAPPAAAAPPTTATEVAPPPSTDPTDPGRPVLKRGGAADPSRQHSAPVPDDPGPSQAPKQVAMNTPPPAASQKADDDRPYIIVRDDDTAPVLRPMSGDDLIRKAADTALDFTEKLPNYVCQEMIGRFESTSKPVSWQALDVLTAEVVYQDGKEDYRKLTKDGRPVNKKLEEMDGSWSTGEFGTVLIDLFSPATAASFHYHKDSRIAGILTKEYEFNVDHQHSHWSIHMGSQGYDPPYKGTVWIDPATARVMRIEMQAYGFPSDFPTDDVESATDYEYVRLGDAKQYLLPVHAETLSCQRGTAMCSRNTIDFRNYHKYTGESTVTFGPVKQ